MLIAHVVLDVPLAQHFDFLAPECSHADLGRIVAIPFGQRGSRKQLVTGIIVGFATESSVPAAKLKPIAFVQRELPGLDAHDLSLMRFCAQYYQAPLGQVIVGALPPALRDATPWRTPVARWVQLTEAGQTALTLIPARAHAQRGLVSFLLTRGAIPTKDLPSEYAALTLKSLVQRGWADIDDRHVGGALPSATRGRQAAQGWIAKFALNDSQQQAVAQVTAAMPAAAQSSAQLPAQSPAECKSKPFLLAGITGSGKTEVYLHVVAEALARGRQALVLVPEINLTPALLAQFRDRFPSARLVEAHSGMAARARAEQYLDAQRGTADIVIGTRLGVFTPMPRLGVIVVDEEHDSSFKQQEGVRYSARDVAIFRAREAGCPVLLGSATPSMESVENADRGRFERLVLNQRANPQAALPAIQMIDLNKERVEDGITQSVIKAIEATIARGEQALVFINRRGFAPALVCTQCGWMPHCKRCAARLVFHRRDAQLKCHHCGFSTRVPTQCGDCGNQELIGAGEGSERIEAALRGRVPYARIARVDRDATKQRGSAEKIFTAASRGELDVLVGTQMLAKGHDFPRLTLVCVLNADGAVFSADFRAAERLVAQLVQVAGRAGRAQLPGRVLVQTRFPAHPLYLAIQRQDHAAYAQEALQERRAAQLPPYAYLAMLRAEAKDGDALREFMALAQRRARSANDAEHVTVWDAVPAPLSRKAGFERQQLLLQSPNRGALQRFLSTWLEALRAEKSARVKWIIDVDPIEV